MKKWSFRKVKWGLTWWFNGLESVLPLQGACIGFWVGELRSHIPWGMAKKKKKKKKKEVKWLVTSHPAFKWQQEDRSTGLSSSSTWALITTVFSSRDDLCIPAWRSKYFYVRERLIGRRACCLAGRQWWVLGRNEAGVAGAKAFTVCCT